jgi:hypothetical protein
MAQLPQGLQIVALAAGFHLAASPVAAVAVPVSFVAFQHPDYLDSLLPFSSSKS